ncbi:hypothetical protein TWF730_009004 [Orbilia blumenaviensis]|uniref:C2H2-type domain-containing protein n=1 Tax=Orbilia blumenaviensis TaxID=1796055 RepID=A0AAV9UZU2_9PEZI
MQASTNPRPTKRPRVSSESGEMILYPPKAWTVKTPILLRKLEPTAVVIKCLEAVANERLLKSSDLIDRVISDQFLALTEIQNRNNTNVKDAKNYLCKHISPILSRLINQYIESISQDGDTFFSSENSQSPIQHKKLESDNENNPNNIPATVDGEQERKMPPPQLFPVPVDPLPSLRTTSGDSIAAGVDRSGTDLIRNWLEIDGAYPLHRNYPVQSPQAVVKTNGSPVENLQSPTKFHWSQATESKSDIGIHDDNISMADTSPVKPKVTAPRTQSISGKQTVDPQDTQSVVSTTRRRSYRSGEARSCTFCGKDLPSPSARKEHESIHIYQLCQYKQYECKQPNCPYKSHRPREIIHHLRNRHGWDKSQRGTQLADEYIDRGPLPEEKMESLRAQFRTELRGSSFDVSASNFTFTTPSLKGTDRDFATDGDELASQNNTVMSMDYSYTQGTPMQAHMQQPHLSSSMFAGMGSTFDDTNSLMRDTLDQSSQIDYAMDEFTHFRNSITTFPTTSFLPQGPQLVGVGAMHAGSTLTNIPSTIDALDEEEDAQGENDVGWSENLVVSTMKGS